MRVRGHPVAQVSNLLYRRLPVCLVLVGRNVPEILHICRLEIGDTADWKSALLLMRVRVRVGMPGVGTGRVTVKLRVELLRFRNDFLLHFFGHLFVMTEVLRVNAPPAGQ